MKLNLGKALYKKSSKVIPGGVQLLSKRPEIFLPDLWPSYYKKAKGCEITDLDNNKFYDFTNCSVGMCPLGYSNDYVNKEVINAIKKSNITTLNSFYEYDFAKLILKLHPWAKMARFTKSGGEAMSVAVRIARAFSGKNKVLFCGYHGWHDWYLSANLQNKNNLESHLLPDISPKGVPKYLKNTAAPFEFNNTTDFEKKFKKYKNDLACVILEPTRAELPNIKFIKKIRQLTKKFNIPLIFDEITVGWRVANGGFHKKIKINPDIAVFSKATSNGFPLGTIIGKKNIMKTAQNSFISSAYWTENIGFVAAISMIKFFIKNNVSKKLIHKGKSIKKIWKTVSKKYEVKIKISGLDPLPVFNFNYHEKNDEMMTYFTQEMLKLGFLAHGSCFIMLSHSNKLIKKYEKAFEVVFKKIFYILNNKKGKFKPLLKGRVKFAKFKNPV